MNTLRLLVASGRRATVVLLVGALFAILATTLLALTATSGNTISADKDDKGIAQGRIMVADGETGLLQVLDLDRGKVIKKFQVDGPASVYTTESGRIGAAFQGAANQVNFIDSGLVLKKEGSKLREQSPRLLRFDLDGSSLGASNPVHFESHDGRVSVHFDGRAADGIDAHNFIIPEADLLQRKPDVLLLTNPAHHGVAIPVPDARAIFTDADPDGEFGTLPSGFTIRDKAGVILQTIHDKDDPDSSCPGMHGETEIGNQFMFGCEDGILVLTQDPASHDFTGQKLPYPDAHRTFTVKSHDEQSIALASIESPDNNFISIDPAAGLVELKDKLVSASPCDYDFEHQSGNLLAVLDTDGNLNIIEVSGWSKVGTVAVTAPFECSFGLVHPELAVGNGKAFVSDPANGKVIEVDLQQVKISRTFDVDGVPRDLTVFGWDAPLAKGDDRDRDEDDDDDEEEEDDD